jgi:hypothetical protein
MEQLITPQEARATAIYFAKRYLDAWVGSCIEFGQQIGLTAATKKLGD